MMRSVCCQFVLAAVLFGLTGCGGSSLDPGMPNENLPPKVPVMPDAMKGANMRPKVLPKAGTPGKGAAAPEGAAPAAEAP